MTNDLLVLEHRLALVQSTQGGECGGWKRLPIRVEQMNVVGGEKVLHRLTGGPLASPEGDGGTIGEHEASLLSLYEKHARGQFIQDELQERKPGFGCSPARGLARSQPTEHGDIRHGT